LRAFQSADYSFIKIKFVLRVVGNGSKQKPTSLVDKYYLEI